ncbi:MAG: RsmE family RNA methyltransferase [Bullifex sp.]
MRVFILDRSYSGESVYQLRKREKDYLIKVLRIKTGDVFTCKDIVNRFYKATVLDGDTISVEPTDDPEATLLDGLSSYKGSIPRIRVYQAICKGKKNETVMRMLTEAGVEEVVFVTGEYCQEKTLRDHDVRRLEDIRREAAQQSGSSPLMNDIRIIPISNAVNDSPYPLLFLHQGSREKTVSLKEALSHIQDRKVSVLIGSEGGISEEECSMLEDQGAVPVLLPTNILRAETAGIFSVGAIETIWET